jgi:hypothetical protein
MELPDRKGNIINKKERMTPHLVPGSHNATCIFSRPATDDERTYFQAQRRYICCFYASADEAINDQLYILPALLAH